MPGLLSDMETEKWQATLSVRVWTSLDLVSTSYIKRYILSINVTELYYYVLEVLNLKLK